MNAAQNGNAFGFSNNYAINNQNMNFNQNAMNQNMIMGNQNMMMGNQNMMMGNQNMMMGNQNMMMGNPNMMMGNQNMMMGNQNMMMGNPNMMMGNPNMMMGNQNYLNNQNNNMGFNNMVNMNGINNNNINGANKTNDNDIHDKEEILLRNIPDLVDEKPNNPNENMISIIFNLSTGPKVLIYVNKNSTFKEAAKKLCQKIDINEKYIDNRLKFLYSSKRIEIDSNLNELRNNSTITVYDDDNVVGT